jgi:hypothetical protein
MLRQAQPLQAGSMFFPQQAGAIPMQTTPAQTGIDISTIMNLMLPMMIVVMMMKMMMGSMGEMGEKPKPKELKAVS